MRNNITAGTPTLRSHGSTLVEAVVLMSLVGIVAAFSVPKFTRLGNEARTSEVQALGASLQQAAQTTHAHVVASGSHLSTIMIAGRTVNLKNGYPDAGTDGIRKAVFDSDGFTATQGDDFVTFSRADAPSVSQCSVTYRTAEAGGAATITNIDTSGC
jgi:MSHA pilin protein MshA